MYPFSQLIYDFIEYLRGMSDVLIFLFFVFSTFIENIFPPWPSDTLILFSGFLASSGAVSLPNVIFASWIGNVLGGLVMYYFGSTVYRETVKIQKKMHVSEKGYLEKIFQFASHESLVKAKTMFQAHGSKFVMFSRFFPGVRFFVSIIAGIYNMNIFLYAASFAAGSLIWGAILVYAGFVLGTHWETALQWIRYYNIFAITFVFSAAALIFIFRRYGQKIKKFVSGSRD